MFSATMPDDIRRLTDEVLHDPVTVKVGHTAPASTVSHALYPVAAASEDRTPHGTPQTDRYGIDPDLHTHQAPGQTRRRGTAEGRVQGCLSPGELSQNKRQDALDGFRNGSYQILVATDIAARGIDVLSISHVINYDMPDTTDTYTHRIGRTGRVAKTGDAFTFVTHEDEPQVKSIEHVLGEKIERRVVKGFDYTKSAPGRYVEFARPSQRRPTHVKPEQASVRSYAAGTRPRTGSTQPVRSAAFGTGATASPPSERRWGRN